VAESRYQPRSRATDTAGSGTLIQAVIAAFQAPDLRMRILFTFGMLVIFRFVAHVPIPNVDQYALQNLFRQEGTGEVLGKGTDNLEGFEFRGKGYFGPGELPSFDREFFDFPHGTKDEWLFAQFKEKLQEKGSTSDEEAKEFVQELGDILSEKTGYDAGL